MPSSPQTITTRGVFDYLESTAGKPIIGATINCTLNFNGASVTSPIVNVGELQQSTTTDQNGFWRFNLIPNDTLTPTGTLYTIQTPINTYDISVPSGGADVQSSSIVSNAPSVLSPALTNLTGPITVTGNETVTGNLSVSGTTTLGSTTTGALTTAAETVGGDLTISSAFRLLFGAAAAKIIPGATSISHRNNADSADNLLITDAGAVTVRNGFTLTAGDAVLTAGRLLVSAAAAKILGGVTSLSLRNNGDTADNVLITDAGLVTLRNALSIPPVAAGTVATSSYGSTLVKIEEQVLGVTTANVRIPASGSLPTGFRHLLIEYGARDTGAGTGVDFIIVQANGDAGANYNSEFIRSTGGVVAGNELLNGTSGQWGILVQGGGGAGAFSAGFMKIVNYGSTSQARSAVGSVNAQSTANEFLYTIGGRWKNTANAMTNLLMAPNANSFAAGTYFHTYGIP